MSWFVQRSRTALWAIAIGVAFAAPSSPGCRSDRWGRPDQPVQTMAGGLQGAPTPTPDLLSPPVLPENPTQVDHGRVAYWYNCMPCHGDLGQGLTDAWRQTWVEDHRNCWARGCHGGRVEDQGFPLPKTIPAIVGSPRLFERFPRPEDLVAYLVATHPPQQPGALKDEEYLALAAFLWAENGQPAPTLERSLRPEDSAKPHILTLAVAALGVFSVAAITFWGLKRIQRR